MASASSPSSSMDKICFYCFSHSDVLRAGWPIRRGGCAMLCNRCATAYEEGSFCNIFHSDASGWRTCVTCNKDLHCGCIMSVSTYTEIDCGGVICTQCMTDDVCMGPMSSISAQTSKDVKDPSEIILYVDLKQMINGSTQGVPSQEDAPSSKKGEQSCTDLPDAADTHFEYPGDKEESKGDAAGMTHSDGQYDAPQMTHSSRRYTFEPSEEELSHIKGDSNSVVIPLFEKKMTGSDANPKNGRFVIPKKCAEMYLPELLKPEGFLIKIQDTAGNDWEFKYRFWPNSNSRMYVLEGINDYLLFHQCKAGDKVSFYRIEPEGKFVMGLKKVNATSETTTETGNASQFKDK